MCTRVKPVNHKIYVRSIDVKKKYITSKLMYVYFIQTEPTEIVPVTLGSENSHDYAPFI
jgi:hypothetical protein